LGGGSGEGSARRAPAATPTRTSSPISTGIGWSQRPAHGIGVAPSLRSASSSASAPASLQIGPSHTRGALRPGGKRAKWW
jgi:hypothetical protein